MISNDQSGLLEKIQIAVQPLTDNGRFVLESISINEWESRVTIKIVSPALTFYFLAGAINSGIGCLLISPSKKRMFLSDHFFPSVDLEKMGLEGEYLEKFPSPDPGTFDQTSKYQAKWDAIMRKTDFPRKLFFLCLGISYKFPEIISYFNEHAKKPESEPIVS